VERLEALYARAWQDFMADALPRPDLGALEAYLEVGMAADHEEIEVQTIAEYHGWWRERLAQRHALRPIVGDHRLLGQDRQDRQD
jgi:hypothetical protein